MSEKVIVVGDVHLGYNDKESGVKSNTQEFKDFIDNKVPQINPDTLVINGDLIELWRSSFQEILVNYSSIIQSINELTEQDIDIVFVPGNHDQRMLSLGRDIIGSPFSDWNVTEEYFFESGDKKFVAVHGHKTDSINRSKLQNNALSLTSGSTGETLSEAWSFALDRPILGWFIKRDTIIGSQSHDSFVSDPVLASRPNLRVLSHIKNPRQLSEDDSKGRFARSIALLKQKYDRNIIGGHTHVREEQPEEGYYNPGDWLETDTGYVVVEDGKVEVKEY